MVQSAVCGVAITVVEFVAGLIINVWLGMGVWDYSAMPGNIMGQVCPQFLAMWMILAADGPAFTPAACIPPRTPGPPAAKGFSPPTAHFSSHLFLTLSNFAYTRFYTRPEAGKARFSVRRNTVGPCATAWYQKFRRAPFAGRSPIFCARKRKGRNGFDSEPAFVFQLTCWMFSNL